MLKNVTDDMADYQSQLIISSLTILDMAYDLEISLEPMYRPAKYCSGTHSSSTASVSCSLWSSGIAAVFPSTPEVMSAFDLYGESS